jgi:hypothetical protein
MEGDTAMIFTARVLRNRWGDFEVVIFKQGISLPNIIISAHELRALLQDVEKQVKEFPKQDPAT